MRLRKPCIHVDDEHPEGHYEGHHVTKPIKTGAWCPGGEFLLEGALVIEKVDGEWPHDVIKTLERGWLKRLNSNVTVTLRLRDSLDALASQVGESER